MGLQPAIVAIFPDTASTAGGAWGTITGSGFERGAIVKLGGEAVVSAFEDSTTVRFWTTAHAAGPVDVAVSNPGGETTSVSGRFSYTSPEAFDVNGGWMGHVGPDYSVDMPFAIQRDRLVAIACGTSETLMLSLPVSISLGEFSIAGDDGLSVQGRLVSGSQAIGTVTAPGCPTSQWWAEKRPGP